MDTGSDKTWVQGEGCIGCFHLCIGNFKSKVSLTYTIVFLEYVMRTFAFVVLTMVMVVTLWVVFHLKHSHSLDVRGRCKLRKCYLWGWLAKWKYEIYDRWKYNKRVVLTLCQKWSSHLLQFTQSSVVYLLLHLPIRVWTKLRYSILSVVL